jgi:hypothetical protein
MSFNAMALMFGAAMPILGATTPPAARARHTSRWLKKERGQRTRKYPVQRVALDQLEHKGRHVAILETVDGPDVRMIERCEQSCFAFEARDAIGVSRERRRQDFQRDVAPKPGVACAIHFAHPAGPEGTEDLVDADAGTERRTKIAASIAGQTTTCHLSLSSIGAPQTSTRGPRPTPFSEGSSETSFQSVGVPPTARSAYS